MKGLKALVAVLVVTGLLASALAATASAAAYRHYIGCGISRNAKPAHVCPRQSKKGAFFKSLKGDVVYSVCVKFPSGKNLCAQAQEAEQGTLYVNKITSTTVGRHEVTWFVKGKKVGTFGTTFLDWLIARAAGKKAYNVDLGTDASLVAGAPPLLNQFLARGEVDATLQFSSLTLGPIARSEQRMVIDMPALMKAAGFRSDLFYLQWMITEKWAKANPEAMTKLPAMLNEAYAVLKRDDGLWPVLAQRINITDPAIAAAYRDLARRVDNPPYSAELIKPTQDLLDAIIAIAGEQAVGVTTVDQGAFLFP